VLNIFTFSYHVVGILEKVQSLVRRWQEGDEEDPSPSFDGSAIERISHAPPVPVDIDRYSLDVNTPVNVRWKNDEHVVECSHTGDVWRTKIDDGNRTGIVARHTSREDAVEAAESIMRNGRVDGTRQDEAPDETDESATDDGGGADGDEDGGIGETAFEDEVESILDDVDVESIEEVNEALSD
jgi:hypothetical protein